MVRSGYDCLDIFMILFGVNRLMQLHKVAEGYWQEKHTDYPPEIFGFHHLFLLKVRPVWPNMDPKISYFCKFEPWTHFDKQLVIFPTD